MFTRQSHYDDNTSNSLVNVFFDIKENEVPGKEPVITVTQDKRVVLSKNPPSAILGNNYDMSRSPTTLLEFNEMRKEWHILRTMCRLPSDACMDIIPLPGRQIVALVDGNDFPVEGIVGFHQRMIGDAGCRDTIFLAHFRDLKKADRHSAPMVIASRVDEEYLDATFVPWEWKAVFAWAYVNELGQLIPPQREPAMRWYVDCEFDDSTKTLLSVGIVTHEGKRYYAYDQEAADKVTDEWLKMNVLPVLDEYPEETKVYDLKAWRDADQHVRTFSDFLETVHSLEYQHRIPVHSNELEINVDFTTDIEYISRLFHIGNGERICPRAGISFKMHGVDSYHGKEGVLFRHNAIWDALVFRRDLGAGRTFPAYAPNEGSGANCKHMREGLERFKKLLTEGNAEELRVQQMVNTIDADRLEMEMRKMRENTFEYTPSDKVREITQNSLASMPVITGLGYGQSIKEHADAAFLMSSVGSSKLTDGQVLDFRQRKPRPTTPPNDKFSFNTLRFSNVIIPKEGYETPNPPEEPEEDK